MALSVSRNGLLFTLCREALVLVAYPDGPHCSAGVGHNDATLKAGDAITKEQAFAWFKADMAAVAAWLNKALTCEVSQQQFDVLADLKFNAGNRYAPAMVALCNAKEFAVAADLLPLCDRNLAGEKKDGLHKRRLLERSAFLDGNYGDLSAIPFWRGDPHTTKRETYQIQPGDI